MHLEIVMPLIDFNDWKAVDGGYRLDVHSKELDKSDLFQCESLDSRVNVCSPGLSYWQFFNPRTEADCLRPICHKITPGKRVNPSVLNPKRIRLVPINPGMSKTGFI